MSLTCCDARGDAQRVEEAVVQLPKAKRPQRDVQRARQVVDAFGDGANAVRAVIDGVHRRHVGQQRLRRADVGRRLLAADVLLAGLQRHAIRGLALRIDGHADDAGPACGARSRSCRRKTPRADRRKPSGTPKRCELPRTTSAPISPGGVMSASASRSEATATSTLASCARAMNGRRSSMRPASSGYWSSTPNVRASNVMSSARGTTRSSMPSGSARLRSTAIVCG